MDAPSSAGNGPDRRGDADPRGAVQHPSDPSDAEPGTLTLGATGAVAGDLFRLIRTSTSAQTYAVVNGGPGAGTLITLPVSKIACAQFIFDGTNWQLDLFGQLA